MRKRAARSSMTLRVLGYKEGKGWAAHCLETNLVGRGRSFEVAVKDLLELTEMQVSFAVQKNQTNLLDHPAPPEIFETYARLARQQLTNFQQPAPKPKDRALGALPFPTAVVKGSMAWCGA